METAFCYYQEGADEIVFYDITASSEKRNIMIDTVKRVAEKIFIPFSVGGGIKTVDDTREVLLAGAEKVSVNSAAVRNPSIIEKGAELYGSQCIVLGMDVKKVDKTDLTPSGYEIVIDGGRSFTGIDALDWAKRGEQLGAGEICLNSIDADGTRDGYELTLNRLISSSVNIPVIAPGGAGTPEHLSSAIIEGNADAVLIASMTHYGEYSIKEIKSYLHKKGIKVRMEW